jgi:integrase
VKIPVVVQEFLATKRSDKLSARYLKQLEYDLKRFGTKFPGPIEPVTGQEIDTWLRNLGIGPRTRNNLRNSIQALYNFAIGRKYLPKDHDEIEAVPQVKDADGEIEIFTPEEMAELLAVATPKQIPFLVIGAFAGVRHAELQRLSWADIMEDAGIIEIRAGTAKTASRRVIPLLPNLAAWLAEVRQRESKLCPYANMVLQFVELTRLVNEQRRAAWARANNVSAEDLKRAEKRARERLAKLTTSERRSHKRILPGADTADAEGWTAFAWKHNALRHSFISYRVADVQNVAQVALEAGNSPAMIFKHYRELVRPAEAKKWFAIAPKPVENVVSMPLAVAREAV